MLHITKKISLRKPLKIWWQAKSFVGGITALYYQQWKIQESIPFFFV